MSEPTMNLKQARSASSVGDKFPYRAPDVCYIAQRIGSDEPLQFAKKREDVLRALNSAHLGEARLFAVWPGKFSSDLFLIDDHVLAAAAFGHALPEKEG